VSQKLTEIQTKDAALHTNSTTQHFRELTIYRHFLIALNIKFRAKISNLTAAIAVLLRTLYRPISASGERKKKEACARNATAATYLRTG